MNVESLLWRDKPFVFYLNYIKVYLLNYETNIFFWILKQENVDVQQNINKKCQQITDWKQFNLSESNYKKNIFNKYTDLIIIQEKCNIQFQNTFHWRFSKVFASYSKIEGFLGPKWPHIFSNANRITGSKKILKDEKSCSILSEKAVEYSIFSNIQIINIKICNYFSNFHTSKNL